MCATNDLFLAASTEVVALQVNPCGLLCPFLFSIAPCRQLHSRLAEVPLGKQREMSEFQFASACLESRRKRGNSTGMYLVRVGYILLLLWSAEQCGLQVTELCLYGGIRDETS